MSVTVLPEQISSLAPNAKDIYVRAFQNADAVLGRYGITENAKRLTMYLAQVLHESGALTVVTENMNYRVDALLKLFSRSRISEADARKYGRTANRAANQQAIANILYGGEFGRKNLGNTQVGDGWKFRGHYLLQHTGRDFFTRMAAKLGIDIEVLIDPERIDPAVILTLACEEWAQKQCNALSDAGDFEAVTRRINGGTIGLEDRKLWLIKTKAVWK